MERGEKELGKNEKEKDKEKEKSPPLTVFGQIILVPQFLIIFTTMLFRMLLKN